MGTYIIVELCVVPESLHPRLVELVTMIFGVVSVCPVYEHCMMTVKFFFLHAWCSLFV